MHTGWHKHFTRNITVTPQLYIILPQRKEEKNQICPVLKYCIHFNKIIFFKKRKDSNQIGKQKCCLWPYSKTALDHLEAQTRKEDREGNLLGSHDSRPGHNKPCNVSIQKWHMVEVIWRRLLKRQQQTAGEPDRINIHIESRVRSVNH